MNDYYTVLIVGDVDVTQYDKNKVVEPYIAYKYSDRHKIKEEVLSSYQTYIKEIEIETPNALALSFMKHKLQYIQDLTDEEYFEELTEGMTYDELTGDAISTINPKGKYRVIKPMSNDMKSPFGKNIFEGTVADLLKWKVKDKERKIYEKSFNSQLDLYKKMFKSKDEYIRFHTAFFTNAFVSEETGWVEQIDGDQIQWGINFMHDYIQKLPVDTKVKIMEYIP